MTSPVGRSGRDVHDCAVALVAHNWQHVLTGEHSAEQVDIHYAVERVGRHIVQWRIAALHADTNIVMQDVDSTPSLRAGADSGLDCRFIGDVRCYSKSLTTIFCNHVGRFLRCFQITVDAADFGAFACKN